MQRASVRCQARAVAAALTLATPWIPCPAAASDVVESDPLVRARVALDDLRVDEAVRLARPLALDPRPKVRVRALEVLALAHLVSGRTAEGKAEVGELYELAPAFVLRDPSLPPHVTEVFAEEAARPHARAAPLSLRYNSASMDPAAFVLLTRAEVAKVWLSCKPASGGPFQPVLTTPEAASYKFRLPTVTSHLCYATAVDLDELPLGRLGTMDQPIEVRPVARDVPAAAADSGAAATSTTGATILTKWWFWAAIGAVAVGTTAAVLIATSNSGTPQQQPTRQRNPGPGGAWTLTW